MCEKSVSQFAEKLNSANLDLHGFINSTIGIDRNSKKFSPIKNSKVGVEVNHLKQK